MTVVQYVARPNKTLMCIPEVLLKQRLYVSYPSNDQTKLTSSHQQMTKCMITGLCAMGDIIQGKTQNDEMTQML